MASKVPPRSISAPARSPGSRGASNEGTQEIRTPVEPTVTSRVRIVALVALEGPALAHLADVRPVLGRIDRVLHQLSAQATVRSMRTWFRSTQMGSVAGRSG